MSDRLRPGEPGFAAFDAAFRAAYDALAPHGAGLSPEAIVAVIGQVSGYVLAQAERQTATSPAQLRALLDESVSVGRRKLGRP